jgi:hypothetical protein
VKEEVRGGPTDRMARDRLGARDGLCSGDRMARLGIIPVVVVVSIPLRTRLRMRVMANGRVDG